MKILIFFLLIVSTVSYAGSQVGTIEKLYISGRDYPAPNQNPTHVYIAGRYDAKPDCAVSGYWALNSETQQGRAILSLLITAQATGKTVSLLGTGDCRLRPDMETLFQVGIENSKQ
ncbi:MAG: hypothetical protein KJO03_02535 [Gammaproteobacteria bacterium]|nr:hypothetical protein [Gammaproteobacteria bacterium]